MPIDLRDAKAQWGKRLSATPKVVYQSIETSTAWQQVEEWLTTQHTERQGRKADILARYANSPILPFEEMATNKALLDITQAEVRIIEAIQQKMQSYRTGEDHG